MEDDRYFVDRSNQRRMLQDSKGSVPISAAASAIVTLSKGAVSYREAMSALMAEIKKAGGKNDR